MGRSLRQLCAAEKQSILWLEKRKSILNVFNVYLTNGGNKPFSYSYWASSLLNKTFKFSILYSRQCSLLAQRLPCYLYPTVPVLWADILDFNFYLLSIRNF